VLFAAPVAVSSYPMAVALNADGELAGQLVAFSTLFSLFTIFGWTVALSALSVL
jgi:predicted permease